jgi:uncharacterized protein YdhG (YjbR/CyaY superfamily)
MAARRLSDRQAAPATACVHRGGSRMKSARRRPDSIDDYIAAFPPATQAALGQVRRAIRKAAPKAVETISYGIPTFRLEGNLVYFAGYARHIGFYPGSATIASFTQELSVFKSAKGSVQFPLDEPMPVRLIGRMVKFKVALQKTKQPIKKAPARRSVR